MQVQDSRPNFCTILGQKAFRTVFAKAYYRKKDTQKVYRSMILDNYCQETPDKLRRPASIRGIGTDLETQSTKISVKRGQDC